MSASLKKFLKFFIPLVILAGGVYVGREPLYRALQYAENRYLPCRQPIAYSIGSFDARFGISRSDFLAAINQAVKIWETPVNKKLFSRADKGSLVVNLSYDYRQEATQKLKSLGLVISDSKASYDTLKAKYDSLQILYDRQKSDLVSFAGAYQAELDAYNSEVTYWNNQGGAPKDEYEKLQQEKSYLGAKVAELNQAQSDFNRLVEDINALATVLNKLVNVLNLNAEKYNTIGVEHGGEFEEGQYRGNLAAGEIDIYQFDDQDKLVRVLAHELGHALGLDHLDNPKAIMYRLNEGTNEKLTPDDIAALKNKCGVK